MSYTYDSTALGQAGSVFLHVDWTPSVAGEFAAIYCITDTVIEDIADAASNTWGGLTFLNGDGFTLPAGTILYGRFTAIEIRSGMAVAYKSIIK